MGEKRTEISELGEFGLIDRIRRSVSLQHRDTLAGIGDDAAVIDQGDTFLLWSTDMLLEGIHFDLTFTPLQHLGHKAVSVNVSDIAAMNGVPSHILVSMALSNRFSVEAVDALYEGIRAACDQYSVDLVGGDTSASRTGLVLSVTVLGRVPKQSVVYRRGAKPGDIVCVTGDLGGAYMGLQVLLREKEAFHANPELQPVLEKYTYIVGRQLRPIARTDIVHELKEAGVVPTSMIDISDGLASDLFHLCNHSGTGVRIFEDKIPIDNLTYNTAALEFKLDPVTCALNGGEDYELLFTISQDHYDKIKNHPDIHFIGYITSDIRERVLITKQNNIVPLQAQGFNHFAQSPTSGR
jgi:thiamine-monophosphate kinase